MKSALLVSKKCGVFGSTPTHPADYSQAAHMRRVYKRPCKPSFTEKHEESGKTTLDHSCP